MWWLNQPYWATKYAQAQSTRRPPDSDQKLADDTDTTVEIDNPTYTLDDVVADGSFVPIDDLARMLARWKAKKNLILQGPPGTGKSFLAKRLGYALIRSKDRETARSRLRVAERVNDFETPTVCIY